MLNLDYVTFRQFTFSLWATQSDSELITLVLAHAIILTYEWPMSSECVEIKKRKIPLDSGEADEVGPFYKADFYR
jgi:hypothetical protein